MGGSGRSYPIWTDSDQKKIDKKKEEEQGRLDKNINNMLNDLLINYNDRDRELIQDHLNELSDIIGEEVEIDQLLFGGSVSKHTDVDGISDVDALVILNRDDIQGKSPKEMLSIFKKILDKKLETYELKNNIQKGKLAITIKYKDGSEIQLLPAFRTKDKIYISSDNDKKWNDIKPKVFQKELTRANNNMDSRLVPVIKLCKAINVGLPKERQLTGYHLEALAIESVKNYKGPKTLKALVSNIVEYSANRVLKPITDKTGQSSKVDEYLGKSNSNQRNEISRTLTSLVRRLNTAKNVSQWRAVFDD